MTGPLGGAILGRHLRFEPRIEVGLRGQDAGGRSILFVADNGIGMDRETREKAFSLFFTSKGVKGTGLGLYASYMLVQTMGGDLSIENRDPCGARACVRLPFGSETLAKDAGVHNRAPYS